MRPRRVCSSSAVATPPGMFAPARLCTASMPACASTLAIIPAVVVLPLVALTTTDAALEPARRARDRVGLQPQQQLARQAGAAAAAADAATARRRPARA